MATKILEMAFPYMDTRSSSFRHPKGASPASSPENSPRPKHTRAVSHPGPAPHSSPPSREKAPARAFGTSYRVRRTPPGTPPASPPNGLAHSNVHDFAHISSSAAHSQPTRRKPVYSMHQADPAVRGRGETVYTEEELLKRLNTIGEDEEVDLDRVKTTEREKEKEWEEERKRKEEREMEEWNQREAKKAQKAMTRGFSWKGVKHVVGGFR